MLRCGCEAVTSRSAIVLVKAYRDLKQKTQHDLRARLPKLYSNEPTDWRRHSGSGAFWAWPL